MRERYKKDTDVRQMTTTYRAAIFLGSQEESGKLITTIDVQADNSTDAKYRAEAAFRDARRPEDLPPRFWVYVFPVNP